MNDGGLRWVDDCNCHMVDIQRLLGIYKQQPLKNQVHNDGRPESTTISPYVYVGKNMTLLVTQVTEKRHQTRTVI